MFQDCLCQDNLALKEGGCFYLKSSNATFERSWLSLNHANTSGGGICALMKATLYIRNTSIISNSANDGGGVALLNGSRLLCEKCLLQSNSANQGGGLFISSNASQELLAQITASTFRMNIALSYGGRILTAH